MLGTTQASTAPEPHDIAHANAELSAGARAVVVTCEQMIREKIPNLFRLYLNPYVAQACHCINEIITTAWPAGAVAAPYQVFLANGMEEALSGAIKLARYTANAAGRRGPGLVFDPDERLEHFAATELSGLGKLEYLPNVEVTTDPESAVAAMSNAANQPSFVVVFLSTLLELKSEVTERLKFLLSGDSRPLLVVCVYRQQLFHEELPLAQDLRMPLPDIVVFDESFVDDAVPFGAFAAAKSMYEPWNQGSMATFHSTTYQPNTISTLHFLRSLEAAQPAFFAQQSATLERLAGDMAFRQASFRELYSPSLAKLISAVDLDQSAMTASGHYIDVPGRRLFDGVAGVACSVRGHNPPSYAAELLASGELEACREEVVERLHALTGLPHAAPAVSGASAVEHALKMALAAQFPRTHVLALQGGYGGKTLFALTGTAKPSLKAGLEPLYPNVVYVDPHGTNGNGTDAIATIDAAFARYPIGVVQLELVQGVGGVRAVPPAVLNHLRTLREKHDCLLFVDEVQTGVYRTGPFSRSVELGIEPDLLAIGKGTSDMMFPFAMTLYSEAVGQVLEARGCSMPGLFGRRYGYEIGYRTLLGTLRRAAAEGLEEHVIARGEFFQRLLSAELIGCRAVREVRCFGLLIGIELNVERFRLRKLKKLASQLYLLGMLHHRPFPLVVGFCQYEPNVLKLTPPLSITEAEVRSVCDTISSVLRMSLVRLAASGLFHSLIRPRLARVRRLFGSATS